jgi:hypothetical protein
MSALVYKIQIPDSARPLPRTREWSPSGELVDFHPKPLASADVIGRRIDGHSLYIGTYGMGGAGMYGLKLGGEWLVIALRGAGAWMRAEGRLVEDFFWSDRGRSKPWTLEGEGDHLAPRITGRTIAGIVIEPDALRITFDDGFALYIESDAQTRPHFEGNGALRAFVEGDDLRRAVFLAPTDELWI